MKVLKLPSEVRSYLQSGLTITDAVQAILELVHNALDADATAIAVRVDLKSYQLQVVDNGCGIVRDDLELVGNRYMTSKCQNIQDLEENITTYGYRGQAICSLAEVCHILAIETKSRNEKITLKKVFIKGKPTPATIKSKERPSSGVTVTMENFMCTMPVRQKRISDVFDMEEIKNQLEHLAIVHYHVSFSLRDDNRGTILLQTHRKSDIFLSFADVYALALAKFLTPVNYEENKYRISGFISQETHSTPEFQFVYVNKRIVSKCRIHDLINDALNKYTGRSKWQQLRRDVVDNAEHNVFLIQIQSPYKYFEMFTNLRKTTVEFRDDEKVMKCILKGVKMLFKIENQSQESDKKKAVAQPKIQVREKNKGNPQFGASQLVNAIRGAPVKRKAPVLDVSRRKNSSRTKRKPDKKRKLASDEQREIVCSSEAKKKKIHDQTIGLPESPIPSNCSLVSLPQSRMIQNSSFIRMTFCQIDQLTASSLRDFQTWLKQKAQTDLNALKLLNEFHHFRKRCIIRRQARGLPSTHTSVRTINISHEKRIYRAQSSESLGFRFDPLKDNVLPALTSSELSFNDAANQPEGFNDFVMPEMPRSNFRHGSDLFQSGFSLDKAIRPLENTSWKTPFSCNSKKRKTDAAVQTGLSLRREHVANKSVQVTPRADAASQTDFEKCVMSPRKISPDYITCGQRINTTPVSSKNDMGTGSDSMLRIVMTDVLAGINSGPSLKEAETLPDTVLVQDNLTESSSNPVGFSMASRYFFVPKGLSPSLITSGPPVISNLNSQQRNRMKTTLPTPDPFLDNVKWQNGGNGAVVKPTIPEEILEKMREKAGEKMIFYEQDVLKASVVKSAAKVHNLLHSFTLTKQHFSELRVIGQVDRKFIAVLMRLSKDKQLHLLTLFDQHAVDERIRLEKLSKEYRDEDGKFSSSHLDEPVTISLNESIVRVASRCADQLRQYGLAFSQVDSTTLAADAVPTCLLDKEARDIKNKGTWSLQCLLQNLITTTVRELQQTRGTSSSVPRVIHDVISSRACRSAVKFNQFLSVEDMERMVDALKECELPFQCAHGRPSVVPIIDLQDFKESTAEKSKPNFKQFRRKI